jgi:iron complex transport system permease protein
VANRRVRPILLFSGLALLLFVTLAIGLGSGAVSISPIQVLGIIGDHVGLDTGVEYSSTQDAVLWSIRLPRVMLGVVVGAALAMAGVGFQGIFRNPLADPQLIGISSGAALGSVVGVLALESILGLVAGALGGVAGGIAAASAVFLLARHEGKTEVVTLVLAGLAVGAVGGAAAAFVSVAADDARLGSVIFYLLGSLGVATWERVWWTLPFVVVAAAVIPLYARRLDLLLLGEREAGHLGVDVDRTRVVVGGAATVAVGAVVAATGIIGFIGLVVPHAIRLLAGPGHRTLVPASAIGGAAAVVAVDTIARTLAQPIEIPIGLLTAIVGGPVFLALILRTRRSQGGWG